LGFKVLGSEFRGSGLRAQGKVLRVLGVGFRVQHVHMYNRV